MVELVKLLEENQFKLFRAKVIDVEDPLKLGRVKVWIPDLMYDLEDTKGLWALPGNRPFGGGNIDQNDGRKHAGSSYTPEVGDWVFIFFENDNINRPYIFGAVDIEDNPIPPENQLGVQYWNKWTVIRTTQGRAIWISDDDATPDSRVMITGKKRLYNPDDPYPSVTKIIDNQTVMMIEEDTINRILHADYKHNYLSINTDEDTIYEYANKHLYIYNPLGSVRIEHDNASGKITIENSKVKVVIQNSDITINSPGTIHAKVPNAEFKMSSNQIKMETSGASFELNNGQVTLFASEQIILQAPLIQENPGINVSPSPSSPESADPMVQHDYIE